MKRYRIPSNEPSTGGPWPPKQADLDPLKDEEVEDTGFTVSPKKEYPELSKIIQQQSSSAYYHNQIVAAPESTLLYAGYGLPPHPTGASATGGQAASYQNRTAANEEFLLQQQEQAERQQNQQQQQRSLNVVQKGEWAVPYLEQGKIYFTPIGGITTPRYDSNGAMSLDELLSRIRPVNSLHLSFLVNVEFLMSCYPKDLRSNPITIVVGDDEHLDDVKNAVKSYPNITLVAAELPIYSGVHNSRLSILESEDGWIHVIVGPNIVQAEWEFKTQQFYHAYGEKWDEAEDVYRNPFQIELTSYLGYYKKPLVWWKDLITRTDFSNVNDRLIFSVPGCHIGNAKEHFGHRRLKQVLSEEFPVYSLISDEPATFVALCSGIGSLGATPKKWLKGEFLASLEGRDPNPLLQPGDVFVMFPCVKDIQNSAHGYHGGLTVQYRHEIHYRQKWIRNCMLKWRSQKNRRTAYVPECKSYVRFENNGPQWQLLTSANLSTDAWGVLKTHEETQVEKFIVRSYEIGVLITDPVRFNIPFDYEFEPYTYKDDPFTVDTKHNKNYHFGIS